jgi:hypothetical protein
MRRMKKNKFRILSLAIIAVLAQGTCVYATSEDTYTKDELNNLEPGYDYKDIKKSDYKVNSYINDYSSTKTPEQAAKENDSSTSTTTTATTTSTADTGTGAGNAIVSTSPSTGVKGDYWGKTSGGKWILLEQGVPVSGWKAVRGKWYYMDPDGEMQVGWMNDGENWYYLRASGEMAYNTIVDGYYLDGNGVMQ